MVTVVGTISERWLERDQFGSNPILEDPGSLDAVLQSHSIQLKLKDPRSVSQYGSVFLIMMLSIELSLLMIDATEMKKSQNPNEHCSVTLSSTIVNVFMAHLALWRLIERPQARLFMAHFAAESFCTVVRSAHIEGQQG